MNKIAFQPSDPNAPKRGLKSTLDTIRKHPGEFLKATYIGQLQGLAGGAIGGAVVSVPFAMALARQPKSLSRMNEIVKAQAKAGTFKRFGLGMDASAPRYGQRVAHHMFELAKGETIGGGVIGMMLQQNNFLKKYDDAKGTNYVAFPKTNKVSH